MDDEPDIIKQLKEEEKQGTLHGSVQSNSEEIELQDTIPEDAPDDSVDFTKDSQKTYIMDKDKPRSIDEKTQIAVALQDLKKRYQALFNSSFELIYLHDFRRRFIDANPSAFKLLGYNKEELASINFSSLLDKGQLLKAIKTIREIRKHGRQKEPIEYRLKTKNGTFVDVETTAEIVYRNGKPYAIQGMARNITERKEAEEKMLMSEYRYRYTLEITGLLGWTTNASGEVLEDVPEWSKYTGQKKEEVTGWGWLAAIHPDDAERSAQAWKNAVATKSNYETEYRIRRHDGIYRYFMARGCPLLNDDGSIQEWFGICIDITEHKKTEQELQESQEKFKRLFDSSPDLIAETDEEGNFLAVNPLMAKSIGVPAEKLIGKNVFDILPKEIAKQRAEFARKALTEGENLEYDDERGGRYFHNIYVPIVHPDGKKTIQLIARDITDQKIAEDALTESEVKYRTLVESASDQIFMIDEEYKLVSSNKAALMLFRKKPNEIIGRPISEIFPKEIVTKNIENVEKVFKTGQGFSTEEKLIIGEHEFWASSSLNPVKNDTGKTTAVLGVVRDITERKKMETDLRNNEEKLRNIIESSPSGITVTDLQGTIVECNRVALEMHGVSTKTELVGKNAFELIAPKDRERAIENLKKTLEQGATKNIEYAFLKKDGSEYPAELSASVIKDPNGKPAFFIAITNDITTRKKSEKALRDSEQRYRAILNQSFQFIGLMTTDGTLIDANESALKLSGIEKSAVLNKPFWETPLWTHSAELQEKLRISVKKASQGEFIRFEATHIAQDGSTHYVDFSLKPIKDEAGNVVFLIPEGRDMNEMKKVSDGLKAKIEELERYKKVTVDRELKMIELKKKIEELEKN